MTGCVGLLRLSSGLDCKPCKAKPYIVCIDLLSVVNNARHADGDGRGGRGPWGKSGARGAGAKVSKI